MRFTFINTFFNIKYFLCLEEQNKLLPHLPAELLSSLPQELSAVLQKEMRDAFFNLAQSQTISTTHIETSNASIAASNEKEIVDTISENKEDAKAEKTATSEQGMYYVFFYTLYAFFFKKS